MTKQEFGLFASALRTYYPKESILPNKEAMQLWYRELQDIPFPVAEAVLRKWVSMNKWSPSIAEIREMTSEVQHGELPDWGNGWKQVRKAISRHGMYDVRGALDSLDPLTRKTVERLGFKELCLSESPETDRANFRMVFETLAKREKENQQMSLPLREAIMQIQGSGMLQLEGSKQ